MHTTVSTNTDPALAAAREALRSCVHCGFCNAVCPTYGVLADEADGPRGRIYLIKGLLEGTVEPDAVRTHLDRCLTCRACEAICPSGVPYASLAERAREHLAGGRSWTGRVVRGLLQWLLPQRTRARVLFALARVAPWVRAVRRVRLMGTRETPATVRARGVLFEGCVQPSAAPEINAAAARILARLGWSLTKDRAGCCGALDHHLADREATRARIRRNLDAWEAAWQGGAETLVVTASGCGAMLKDYGRLMADDPQYAERAAVLSSRVRDISQCIDPDALNALALTPAPAPVALHRPCTLDFPLNQGVHLERLLKAAGFSLTPVDNEPRCCGSAGSYSLLEPRLARVIRHDKLRALEAGAPHTLLTANIGCLMHLRGGTRTPVRHWVEALAERLPPRND